MSDVPLSELIDSRAASALRALAAQPAATPTPPAESGGMEVKGEDAVTGTLEHKGAPGGATQVLEADPTTGRVTALVSVTGIEDKVKDVIEPGAYTKTLGMREPIGVWSHDDKTWVARTESAKELAPGDPFFRDVKTMDGQPWPAAAGGVLVEALFNLETPHGKAAFSDVKFFQGKTGWSIGYRATKAHRNPRTGVRHIKELDWFEFSPVMVGAASQPLTLSVKSLSQPVDADDATGLVDDTEVLELLEPAELKSYVELKESLGLEVKDRVRTAAGVTRFGQPLGSVIIKDSIPKVIGDDDLAGMIVEAAKKGDTDEVAQLRKAANLPKGKRRAALEKGELATPEERAKGDSAPPTELDARIERMDAILKDPEASKAQKQVAELQKRKLIGRKLVGDTTGNSGENDRRRAAEAAGKPAAPAAGKPEPKDTGAAKVAANDAASTSKFAKGDQVRVMGVGDAYREAEVDLIDGDAAIVIDHANGKRRRVPLDRLRGDGAGEAPKKDGNDAFEEMFQALLNAKPSDKPAPEGEVDSNTELLRAARVMAGAETRRRGVPDPKHKTPAEHHEALAADYETARVGYEKAGKPDLAKTAEMRRDEARDSAKRNAAAGTKYERQRRAEERKEPKPTAAEGKPATAGKPGAGAGTPEQTAAGRTQAAKDRADAHPEKPGYSGTAQAGQPNAVGAGRARGAARDARNWLEDHAEERRQAGERDGGYASVDDYLAEADEIAKGTATPAEIRRFANRLDDAFGSEVDEIVEALRASARRGEKKADAELLSTFNARRWARDLPGVVELPAEVKTLDLSMTPDDVLDAYVDADPFVEFEGKGSSASLNRSPKQNWIEAVGGQLPPYVREVARSIEKTGKTLSQAIPIAIGRIKVWARGGGNVTAETVAKASKAAAQWAALKARAGTKYDSVLLEQMERKFAEVLGCETKDVWDALIDWDYFEVKSAEDEEFKALLVRGLELKSAISVDASADDDEDFGSLLRRRAALT